MLDIVKQRINELISAYEKEKMEKERLHAALEQAEGRNETCRKQITELERQIDNLKLAGAFKADGEGNPEAKKKIDSLMKEIDRCIALLEG